MTSSILSVWVGLDGAGTLNITNGGTSSSSGRVYLGEGSGSVGVVTLEGAGSTLSTGGDLRVGDAGTGILNINSGTQVSVSGATLVGDQAALGTINFGGGTLATETLQAAAADLTGNGTIHTHGLATSIDLVLDSAQSLQQQLLLNSEPGQNITINLDVDGSGTLEAGYNGQGSLTIRGGVSVPSYQGLVGHGDGAVGTATVDGSGSAWSIAAGLLVARDTGSSGTLNIVNDGVVNADYVWVGNASDTGRLVFDHGTLNTDWLMAGPNQLLGTGVVNTHGLISDVDLVFDQSHPLQQDLTFDGLPGQDIAIHLDVNGEGALGAGACGAGSLTISEGVSVVSAGGKFGGAVGSTGTAMVTGNGTKWDMSNGGVSQVGYRGVGTLSITGGAEVLSDFMSIGEQDQATGTVLVDGATWTSTHLLNIGLDGTGTVTITGGSQVISGHTHVGEFGSASVTVDEGSSWTATWINVGTGGGVGTVTVTGGSHLSSEYSRIGSGVMTVDGIGTGWVNDGTLLIGSPDGTGTVTVAGGTVDIGGRVRLSHGGTLRVSEGVLRMHGGDITALLVASTFDFTGGRLEDVGRIYLSAPFVQCGGTLAPGNSVGATHINFGYTLGGGAIEIEVNGLGTAGTDWDLVDVYGPVDLVGDDGLVNGLLNVILGYAPSPGDEFLVLENDDVDPIIGMFATGTAARAAYDGDLYQFTIDYAAGDGNDIALVTQGAIGLVGDYNGDGTVDPADYTVWRDTLGTTVAPYFGADGNGDGVVDEADHAVWKTHYGAVAGGEGTAGQTSSGTQAAVPEPAAALLLMVGGAVLGALARRRRGAG